MNTKKLPENHSLPESGNLKMAKVNNERTIEILLDALDRLMALLLETAKAEEAQAIYDEFFGS